MKDDLVYVEHVLGCIARVQSYTAGRKAVFIESIMVQDAVIRNLQVMAESTTRISEAIRNKHPEIDWRGLAGFRNVLAHGYLGIDLERVWDLIGARLAPLKAGMERIRAAVIAEGGAASE